jgi:Transcriptional regulator, AbiEi antitoxin
VSEADVALARLTARQHGVFTVDQARCCGLSERTVRSRVASGRYERLHPGVFAVAGVAPSWSRDVIGAVLSIRGLGAASHRTAAHLWEMVSHRPRRIEVVAVRHRRVDTPTSTIHESVDLLPEDVVLVDGIPTTTARRTVVDMGASSPPWLVERALDTGLRMGLFTTMDVRRLIARVARSGRNGIGTIRPLIDERLRWESVTESVLEDLFRSVLSESGVEMPVPQFEVVDPSGTFVCRADFAYPDRAILIELDSERYHMDPIAFQRDRDKQNRAQQLGWTVFRFTWRQLIDRPHSVTQLLASETAR